MGKGVSVSRRKDYLGKMEKKEVQKVRGGTESLGRGKEGEGMCKETGCAAKAFCYCPSMISHRPRSQNILKERALNPEKDSRIKRPRSHVSLEKSSQNYKPLEN